MGNAANENGTLTDAVKTWQSGLVGITPEQIANGLKKCVASSEEWFPSLPKFRNMCLQRDELPSISEIVQILLNSARSNENVAKRYKHPIAYAIVQSSGFDVLRFRYLNYEQAEKMIKPFYERLLQTGWEEFKPEHYEARKQLEYTPDKDVGKEQRAEIRKILRGF